MSPLDFFWILLGVVVLAITLADVFLAVLNYEESGVVVDRFVRVMWVALRAGTRRINRRWRPLVLRQVTGVLILSSILLWFCGIALGFASIYLGAMGAGAFQLSSGEAVGPLTALYLSVGQFSTVGADNIAPGAPVVGILTVCEALLSVVMVSLVISFLSSVYDVIQSLRRLCSNFFRGGHGIGDPVDTLEPFFVAGRSRGLDTQLGGILDDFNAYADGLWQNENAYYFQSGRDQFALPFAMEMTAGVIGALRWGLPAGHELTTDPTLLRLTEAFDDFSVRLCERRGWQLDVVPPPVSRAAFDEAVAAFGVPGPGAEIAPWVLRFLTVGQRMRAMTRSTEPVDADAAYDRYVSWFSFACRARYFCAAISRDLDYQPIYRASAATNARTPVEGDGDVVIRPASPGAQRRLSGLRAWLRRRRLFLDPGRVRLSEATRTLLSVAVAIVAVLPLVQGLDGQTAHAAAFAGLIALFSAPLMMGVSAGANRWVGLIAAVPAVAGIGIGVLVPREAMWNIAVLAFGAALSAGLRRFGPRVGGLGQLMFVVLYYTVLLGEAASDAPGLLIAVGVGLLSTWAVGFVPGPSGRRVLDSGLNVVYERVGLLLETATDIVSWGRRDRRLTRLGQREQARLQQATTAIAGQLGARIGGISAARSRTLRLRVFDVQLAAQHVMGVLPAVSGIGVAAPVRARLAAEIVAVHELIAAFRVDGSVASSGFHAELAPADWPRDARRARAAILEMRRALECLRHAQMVDEAALVDPGDPSSAGHPVDVEHTLPRSSPARTADRQAVQAGVSTGLALALGSLVSTSHQYWAALPAFQVLSGSDGETRVRAVQRVLATLLGSGAAFGLAIIAGHNVFVALPVLVVSVFFMSFLRPVSPVWATFWQTVLLAAAYDAMGALSVETVQVRLAETAIGSVVAVLVSAVLLPTRTRTAVLNSMVEVLDRAKALADAVFSRVLDGWKLDPDAVTIAQEAGQRLSRLEVITAGQRRNPGALARTGVEAQLTSLWSVLYCEEHLGRVLRDSDETLRSAVDWSALHAATTDNFRAAQAVLSGRLPKSAHPPSDFDIEPPPGAPAALGDALLEVQRLNQSLLALMDAVQPETSTAMSGAGSPSPAQAETAGRATTFQPSEKQMDRG